MPATKTKDLTIADLLEPKPAAIDIGAHQKDLARRKAERDAKRPLLRDCLNPFVAAQHEAEKPHFYFTVKARWSDRDTDYEDDAKVVAQNESDAWARFCDKIGMHPSRRDCDEVSIACGKQVGAGQVAQCIRAESEEIASPRKKVKPSARNKSGQS